MDCWQSGAVMPGHAGQYYQRVLPAAQVGMFCRNDSVSIATWILRACLKVPFASTEGRKLFKKALQVLFCICQVWIS